MAPAAERCQRVGVSHQTRVMDPAQGGVPPGTMITPAGGHHPLTEGPPADDHPCSRLPGVALPGSRGRARRLSRKVWRLMSRPLANIGVGPAPPGPDLPEAKKTNY